MKKPKRVWAGLLVLMLVLPNPGRSAGQSGNRVQVTVHEPQPPVAAPAPAMRDGERRWPGVWQDRQRGRKKKPTRSRRVFDSLRVSRVG